MSPIKNPWVLAIVVGALEYLAHRYPELRSAVNSILLVLGVGGGATAVNAMVHGATNGKNGACSGNPRNCDGPTAG